MYSYEIEVCGVRVKNSKVIQKELTEEEKAEMEAKNAKGGKAAPAKGKAKEEEPNAEEIERQSRLKLEKEEEERIKQAEWDALDEETKFYRTHEDPFKEPSIRMQNLVLSARLEKLQEQLTAMGAPGEDSEP